MESAILESGSQVGSLSMASVGRSGFHGLEARIGMYKAEFAFHVIYQASPRWPITSGGLCVFLLSGLRLKGLAGSKQLLTGET